MPKPKGRKTAQTAASKLRRRSFVPTCSPNARGPRLRNKTNAEAAAHETCARYNEHLFGLAQSGSVSPLVARIAVDWILTGQSVGTLYNQIVQHPYPGHKGHEHADIFEAFTAR